MATKMLNVNKPITCMALNADGSQMVIGCADYTAQIFQFDARSRAWNRTHTLQKHTGRITGVDWANNTGKIVTVSSDRNAYVWQFNGRSWEPELVLLRLSRAATCVKWSPKEDKFAVGSSARLATICYWESGQKCWVSKHIKKPIKSTISCIDWHPNNYLIAAGSTDMTCRVFSAYIKDIEQKPSELSWGKKLPFGACLSEYPVNGWVSAVSFSACGDFLAFSTHDSTLQVAQGGNPNPVVYYGNNAPFTGLEWSSKYQILAVGHDRCPFEFAFNGNAIQCLGKHPGKAVGSSGGIGDARARFKNMDLARQTTAASVATAHVSPISDICVMDGCKGNVNAFVTCGGEGLVFLWQWRQLANQLQQ